MNGWLCLRICHLLSWLFIDITQVRATACQTAARPRTTHAHYLSSPSLSWLCLDELMVFARSSSGFAQLSVVAALSIVSLASISEGASQTYVLESTQAR